MAERIILMSGSNESGHWAALDRAAFDRLLADYFGSSLHEHEQVRLSDPDRDLMRPIWRERADVIEDLLGWSYSYGGPGRFFSHEPYVAMVTRTMVLIRQSCGLDI